MSDQASSEITYYRLAPLVAARFLGAGVVALAVVVFVVTAVVGLTGIAFEWILLVVGVGLVGVLALGWWLRAKAYVVRATAQGYAVRLVRGAGVREARWVDVAELATTTAHGADCLIIRLKDGGTTTVPVSILALDQEQFVHEVKARLSASVRAAGGGGRRRG